MNLFLLDVSIEPVSRNLADYEYLWVFLLLLLVVILIEAVVIALFKITNFWKALLGSACVNIVSTVIGYLLINKLGSLTQGLSSINEWLLFLAETIILEGIVMMLLYSRFPKAKLWLTTVVMNLASYIFLYLISSL